MGKLLAIALALIFTACSTDSEHAPKEIDTEMEKVGKTDGKDYGYNKDGEVVIQQEDDPGHQLMITKRVNQNLFLELERDGFALDDCIQQYSDPRLKGDGKFKNVDDYESLRPNDSSKEELGVTSAGKLKVVKKSYLIKELKDAKAHTKTLKKTLSFVQKELRKCETELKYRKAELEKSGD